MKQNGQLITLEGIEGVGKSTAMAYINQYLQEKGYPVVVTREPGGTIISESIRQLLLSPHEEVLEPISELLLMFAARAQHIANIIQPALEAGQIVICDRFVDASFAYQGGGRGLNIAIIEQLEKMVVADLTIHRTLLFDAPVEIGLKRAMTVGQPDRIEAEQVSFFKRVRQMYLQRAQQYPKRFRCIDATKPLSDVRVVIAQFIDELLLEFPIQ